jgi:uncharacterized protein YlaI
MKKLKELSIENKLSAEVIQQIKNFIHYKLTEEQNSLLEELIFSKELREKYVKYGLCQECQQPNTGHEWCQVCNSQHFAQDFDK